jgi:hypothetical protein
MSSLLAALSPLLLQPPDQNPNATLITLFLNAVMEIVKAGDEKDSVLNTHLLMDYLPRPDRLSLAKRRHDETMGFRTLIMDLQRIFRGNLAHTGYT